MDRIAPNPTDDCGAVDDIIRLIHLKDSRRDLVVREVRVFTGQVYAICLTKQATQR
jgi:hypothetical protein